MPHGRKSYPLKRKSQALVVLGQPVKMSGGGGIGFGLFALLRGSSRPFKVCDMFYAPLYYGAVLVEQKLLCGDQSQIFFVSCAIARVARADCMHNN